MATPETDVAATKLRALVVDDDPVFRTMLSSMLKHEYDVTAACDGKDGFYKAIELPPDVGIIDVKMPVWDGLKLLHALRGHELLGALPIVMLTSDASRETVLAAIREGADDYIIKTSLSRSDLLQKLSRVRERRRTAATATSRPPHRSASCSSGMNLPTGKSPEATVAADVDAQRLQEVLDAWE